MEVRKGYESYTGSENLPANLDKIEYTFSTRPDETASGFYEAPGTMLKDQYLWLSLTSNSSNGKTIKVEEKYYVSCPPVLDEQGECECLRKAFMPAMRRPVANLIRSPDFPGLLTPADAEPNDKNRRRKGGGP